MELVFLVFLVFVTNSQKTCKQRSHVTVSVLHRSFNETRRYSREPTNSLVPRAYWVILPNNVMAVFQRILKKELALTEKPTAEVGLLRKGSVPPSPPAGAWGSAVSSSSGVRGRALATKGISCSLHMSCCQLASPGSWLTWRLERLPPGYCLSHLIRGWASSCELQLLRSLPRRFGYCVVALVQYLPFLC